MYLFLLHGQDIHGAGLGAEAAGDTFAGCGGSGGHDHDVHGTGLHAFAAAHALLLVDHVHALGILADGALRAGARALAAHDAAHDLWLPIRLGGDADAAQIGIKGLVEGLGAGADTAQTGLAGVLFTDD